MKRTLFNVLILVTFGALILSSAQSVSFPVYEKNSTSVSIQHSSQKIPTKEDTEYWALIIAVGEYEHCPDMNRPKMLTEAARFSQLLPFFMNWDTTHMKVITGEDATVVNIYQGFKWLDDMEDENDVCLIYLTTHGFPLWYDRPPFDEADGKDEALASYRGFLPYDSPFRWELLSNPFGIIIDDQFNRWFNALESNSIGVIVDSCHSGGFNDNFNRCIEKSTSFSSEFAQEITAQNRIVLTSVSEEDISYGSYFSHYLIDGFQGSADKNYDGCVTMEEAFYYAKNKVESYTSMKPQIFDQYPGELKITIKNTI